MFLVSRLILEKLQLLKGFIALWSSVLNVDNNNTISYKVKICSIVVYTVDDNTLHGPVFIQEPSNVVFALNSEEKKVKLNCEVKGNPKPTIRSVTHLFSL